MLVLNVGGLVDLSPVQEVKNILIEDYPFGYGLTYTEFEISPDKFQADEKEVTAYVAVKNTGAFPGKELETM